MCDTPGAANWVTITMRHWRCSPAWALILNRECGPPRRATPAPRPGRWSSWQTTATARCGSGSAGTRKSPLRFWIASLPTPTRKRGAGVAGNDLIPAGVLVGLADDPDPKVT